MSNWIENIVDPDYLKDNMTFVSLFITVYESMTDYVVSNVYDFLCDWKVENGKEIHVKTASYKERIENRVVDDEGHKDKTKASFLWLVDYSAITQKDYESFLSAKKVRNKYAHELFNVILTGVSEADVNCFFSMVSVFRKIANWWFVEYEAGIAGDEITEGAELDKAQSVTNVVLDMIIDVLYNGKSEEYKNMIDAYKDGGKHEV